MKTKKASKTNTKSRGVFFVIALTYNPTAWLIPKCLPCTVANTCSILLAFVIANLPFLIDTRSKVMRAVISFYFFSFF